MSVLSSRKAQLEQRRHQLCTQLRSLLKKGKPWEDHNWIHVLQALALVTAEIEGFELATQATSADPGKTLAGIKLKELEMDAIRATLELTEGNRRKAAEILGIGERTLYRKLESS